MGKVKDGGVGEEGKKSECYRGGGEGVMERVGGGR